MMLVILQAPAVASGLCIHLHELLFAASIHFHDGHTCHMPAMAALNM